MQPTLSVLLATLNDRWRLGTQLEAIIPQLRPCDELIVLLDGSDELTQWIAYGKKQSNIVYAVNPQPSGVCAAYNQCAALARGDWLLGASGNDEVQPGALAEWLDVATRFPDSRVIFGHIFPWEMKPWLPANGFVRPGWLPAIWLDQGWQTHGAAAFIRRDAWGEGYPRTLSYMADHYQSMMLAFEHGCGYIRKEISRVNFLPAGASQAHNDKVSREKEKEEFLRLVETQASPEARLAFKLFDRITGWSKPEAE